MHDKINLADKLALFSERFSPKTVGYLNDYKLQLVKVKGEFVWHRHEETDDFFLVLHGRLTIQLRDRDVDLEAGELFVVPRGSRALPEGGRGGTRPPHRAPWDAEHRRRGRPADRAGGGDLTAT